VLDINYYRHAEENAKNSLPTWLISKQFNLDIFEKEGFPVRLNNNQQLRQVFDTMQENRFDIYMKEMGGLTTKDLNLFLNGLNHSIEFQRLYFPKKKPILPLDTLMAFFTIYHKIYHLNTQAESILEIGPGCGFSAFFLNRFKNLKNYTYTDACESFYMLQNHINFFMLKGDFIQHAIEEDNNHAYTLDEDIAYSNHGIEKELYFDIDKKAPCYYNAFPWWKLNDLNKSLTKFDIVTSNANLLEFDEGALNSYLSIIKNKLSHKGLFFVHCPGNKLLKDLNYLLKKLKEFKLTIVFYAAKTVKYNHPSSMELLEKRFRVPNIVIVNEGHKLYNTNTYNYETSPFLKSGDVNIDDVFLPNKEYYTNRKIYTKHEIKEAFIQKTNLKR